MQLQHGFVLIAGLKNTIVPPPSNYKTSLTCIPKTAESSCDIGCTNPDSRKQTCVVMGDNSKLREAQGECTKDEIIKLFTPAEAQDPVVYKRRLTDTRRN